MSTDFQISQAYQPVAAIGVDARASFINRTYNHLMGAIVLFTLIEVGLFQSGYAASIAQALLGNSWLLVLGAFVLVSWFASRIALTSESKGAQYAALGTWFWVAMIGFAGAAILYDTSNVLHHFPEDRYVGAALQLFASVALMFWYVLRLFMASRD